MTDAHPASGDGATGTRPPRASDSAPARSPQRRHDWGPRPPAAATAARPRAPRQASRLRPRRPGPSPPGPRPPADPGPFPAPRQATRLRPRPGPSAPARAPRSAGLAGDGAEDVRCRPKSKPPPPPPLPPPAPSSPVLGGDRPSPFGAGGLRPRRPLLGAGPVSEPMAGRAPGRRGRTGGGALSGPRDASEGTGGPVGRTSCHPVLKKAPFCEVGRSDWRGLGERPGVHSGEMERSVGVTGPRWGGSGAGVEGEILLKKRKRGKRRDTRGGGICVSVRTCLPGRKGERKREGPWGDRSVSRTAGVS